MTALQRAAVAAFLARREHGDPSPEYERALEEMERQQPRKWCPDCGKTRHRGPCEATP